MAHNTQYLKPNYEGRVTNPNGRPKGSKNIKTRMLEWLETEVEIKTTDAEGKPVYRTMTYYDKLMKALVTKGASGGERAIELIFDRLEGKAKQDIELGGSIEMEMSEANKILDKIEKLSEKLNERKEVK